MFLISNFYQILKGGGILYIYYQKTMSISNMFIYKLLYEKKKSSRYHCCSNVSNSEDSNALVCTWYMP